MGEGAMKMIEERESGGGGTTAKSGRDEMIIDDNNSEKNIELSSGAGKGESDKEGSAEGRIIIEGVITGDAGEHGEKESSEAGTARAKRMKGDDKEVIDVVMLDDESRAAAERERNRKTDRRGGRREHAGRPPRKNLAIATDGMQVEDGERGEGEEKYAMGQEKSAFVRREGMAGTGRKDRDIADGGPREEEVTMMEDGDTTERKKKKLGDRKQNLQDQIRAAISSALGIFITHKNVRMPPKWQDTLSSSLATTILNLVLNSESGTKD
jgi:hypothetical protein